MTTLLSAFASINPVWLFGPYNPGEISAGSQPDWYMGFLEGSLRLFPNWETTSWGYTIPWNVLGPALIIPGLLFTPMIALPVHRTLGHRRQRASTTCWTGRATCRPAPASA